MRQQANTVILKLVILSFSHFILQASTGSLNCTFDDDFCDWTSDKDDDFDWKRGKGIHIGSAFVSDHTTGDGLYIYIDAYNQRAFNRARIRSPMQAPGAHCLTLWYNMNWWILGALIIYVKTVNGRETLIFTINTSIGSRRWQKAVISRKMNLNFQVVLEGVRGWSSLSDIAVDDISITDEFCAADCNFESGFCDWVQDLSADFDWRHHQGGTNTSNTGPPGDHTSGHGYYIYIDTSEANSNYNARILSPWLREGKYCFSFWYYMYGEDVETLTVQTGDVNQNKSAIVEITGAQQQKWIQENVRFSGTGPTILQITIQIIIEGTVKDSWGNRDYGDIAIDDVEILSCHDCLIPKIANGIMSGSYNYNTYNQTMDIACEDGYDLVGNKSITCQADGYWSALPTCDLRDCSIPKIANGIMSGPRNYTTYNQTVDIACKDGYNLIGNKMITYQADGYWSALPTCDLRESMNSSDFPFFVYVTLPLVAVALAIFVTAIVCRKKVLRYFASRRQPGNVKKENVYENESHQHVDLSQGDENVVIADERHAIGQGEIIEFSTIADAATTTVIEIQHSYNNTKTNRVQVVDNVMKQTKGATKDCNHGYAQSVGETSTSEYYNLGPQSVDEKHYSVLMRDEEEIKADDGATKNEYEQIVDYYTLGQQSVDEKHYSVLKRDDNDRKANNGATDIEYEQPVGATPEYFVL